MPDIKNFCRRTPCQSSCRSLPENPRPNDPPFQPWASDMMEVIDSTKCDSRRKWGLPHNLNHLSYLWLHTPSWWAWQWCRPWGPRWPGSSGTCSRPEKWRFTLVFLKTKYVVGDDIVVHVNHFCPFCSFVPQIRESDRQTAFSLPPGWSDLRDCLLTSSSPHSGESSHWLGKSYFLPNFMRFLRPIPRGAMRLEHGMLCKEHL